MKVSIVIPAYNCEHTLLKTVKSLTTQIMRDFELLIINDGSTDNTKQLANKLANEDDRITVITVPNGGPAKARNLGIEKAKGDYIWFVDSDDIADEEMLSQLIRSDKGKNHDVICCGYYMDTLNPDGKIIATQVFYYFGGGINGVSTSSDSEFARHLIPFIHEHLAYTVWNKLYRRQFLLDNQLRFEDYMSGEDRLFNLKLLSALKTFAVCPIALYHYMVYSDTSLSGRYVSDRFEVAVLCDEVLITLLKRLELTDEKSQEVAAYAFMKQALASITQLYTKSCPLSPRDKNKKIKEIAENKRLQESTSYRFASREQRISALILKSKKVFLIKLFAKLINFLQNNFKSLFLQVKYR